MVVMIVMMIGCGIWSFIVLSPMQITWSWPPEGRFSHDLITLRQRKREHKVVRRVWETHYKKIYHMNIITWFNPLYIQACKTAIWIHVINLFMSRLSTVNDMVTYWNVLSKMNQSVSYNHNCMFMFSFYW